MSMYTSHNNRNNNVELSLLKSSERDLVNSIVHMNRYKAASTPFLKVRSHALNILEVNPKEIRKSQIQKAKSDIINRNTFDAAFSLDNSYLGDYYDTKNTLEKKRPESPLKQATNICRFNLLNTLILFVR